MGNQHCSRSQNFDSEYKKNLSNPDDPEVMEICQKEPQTIFDEEENKNLKNFLDIQFKRNECATKKIEFQIKKSQTLQKQNSETQKQSSFLKLEEYSNDVAIEKTDLILEKTDSQIFISTEMSNKLECSSQRQTQSATFQQKNSTKLRSSFASYNSHYKKLNIKQSNFIKIRNKNFQVSYQLLQKIGQGATCTVFKTRCKKTNQIRAVKIIKTKILKRLNETEKIHSELNILKNLDHPNIIKVYDVYFTEEFYYVVTEYCSGGTLFQYILKNSNISQVFIKSIIRQLLRALSYIHSQSIIHRDIKLDNIVFDVNPQEVSCPEDVQIKIIDFGLAMNAKFKSLNKDQPCLGTPLYMAPQNLKGNYSQKSDVWSCGVVLHYLLFHQFPYASVDIPSLYLKISSQELDLKKNYWKNLEEKPKQLLLNMLERNSVKRMTAVQVLSNQWLQGASNNDVKTQKDLIFRKLHDYKKENNFIRLIESYLIFLKTNREQQRNLIALFHKLDKNSNGAIDLQQLKDAFNGIPNSQTAYLKQMLSNIDKNNSGKIEISQFLTFLSDRSKLFTESNLQDAFDFLDENKSGYIDKSELKLALKGCQKEEYKLLWKDIDKDCDNKISKQQFMQYLLRMQEIPSQ